MSARRSQPEDLRVVRALARESAELAPPPIDWGGIERRVFESIEGDRAPHGIATRERSPARWSRRSWIAPLAVAAAVALTWWTQTSHAPATRAAGRRIVPTVHDERGWTVDTPLQRGDVVDSGADRFHYELPGVVSFALPAGTQVEVVAVGAGGAEPESLTIELRWGSIHAEVIHRERGEAFGVEVGGTRVAVHGTSFSVSREGERALVDVRHGSVAVGPVGHRGSTQGWLVVGPNRASFSLDGARDVRWLTADAMPRQAGEPALGTVAHEVSPPPVTVSPAPANGGRMARAGAPRDPASSARPANAPLVVDSTPGGSARESVQGRETASILKKLGACYNKQASALGMRFSVDSTLTMSLYPNGTVRQGVFDPPLSPTLMVCASEALTQARFAASTAATELRLTVHLSQPNDP